MMVDNPDHPEAKHSGSVISLIPSPLHPSPYGRGDGGEGVSRPQDSHAFGNWLSGTSSGKDFRRRQSTFLAVLSLVIVLMVLIDGCTAGTAMSDTSNANRDLAELAGQQRDELTSYAVLLRVKMRHEGKISDFRTEVFSEGDSLLSVYVRGFLGHSAFKALLRGDSLMIYFPSERKYYSGWRHDIETGELRDTRYIIDYLLALLQGYVALPDSAQWSNHVAAKSSSMQLATADRAHLCELSVDLSVDQQEFPYQRWRSLELQSSSGNLRINLQVQSSHYNRQIPAEKFAIDLPPTTIRISKDQLVEMLTGVAP
jgi:hypothetical protein